MKKSMILVAALALQLFLQACQTGPSQRVLTTGAAGAILGAGAGMMAGGDDKRNAAIGAAVGAIAGVSAGVYMDKQEEKLRQQTAGTGIEVDRVGDRLQLTMPSSVTFSVNSAPSRCEPTSSAAARRLCASTPSAWAKPSRSPTTPRLKAARLTAAWKSI